MDAAEIEFLTLDRKTNLAESAPSRAVAGVPYGRYILRARIPSAVSERQILVNTSQMWVIASVPFVYGDRASEGGWLKVDGKTVPPPKELTFVRMRGVFLDAQREALVDEHGAFSVGGLESGLYVVEVFTAGILRHASTVDIDYKEPATRLRIVMDQTGAPVAPPKGPKESRLASDKNPQPNAKH